MSNPSNPSQSYILIMKIRSDLFLKKMFSHVKERKKLQILRENKRIRYEINISIDDYKNFKKTEIIIIPKKIYMMHSLILLKKKKTNIMYFLTMKKKKKKIKKQKYRQWISKKLR